MVSPVDLVKRLKGLGVRVPIESSADFSKEISTPGEVRDFLASLDWPDDAAYMSKELSIPVWAIEFEKGITGEMHVIPGAPKGIHKNTIAICNYGNNAIVVDGDQNELTAIAYDLEDAKSNINAPRARLVDFLNSLEHDRSDDFSFDVFEWHES